MKKQMIDEGLVKGGCGHSAEELVESVITLGNICLIVLAVAAIAAIGGCIL